MEPGRSPRCSGDAQCAAPESCRPASLENSSSPEREAYALEVPGGASGSVPYRALPFLSIPRAQLVAGIIFFIGFVGNVIAFVYAGIACKKDVNNC